jgi:hypothetical protein
MPSLVQRMLAEGLNAKIQNSSALALAESFVMQDATTCTRTDVLTLWQRRNVLTPGNYIESWVGTRVVPRAFGVCAQGTVLSVLSVSDKAHFLLFWLAELRPRRTTVKNIALVKKPQVTAAIKESTQGKVNPALRYDVLKRSSIEPIVTVCAKRNKHGLMATLISSNGTPMGRAILKHIRCASCRKIYRMWASMVLASTD